MAAHGRTIKTNGQALASTSAIPALMIVSDRYIGLRDQACAPLEISCVGCPAGLSFVRRSTNRPAEPAATMNPAQASATPTQ